MCQACAFNGPKSIAGVAISTYHSHLPRPISLSLCPQLEASLLFHLRRYNQTPDSWMSGDARVASAVFAECELDWQYEMGMREHIFSAFVDYAARLLDQVANWGAFIRINDPTGGRYLWDNSIEGSHFQSQSTVLSWLQKMSSPPTPKLEPQTPRRIRTSAPQTPTHAPPSRRNSTPRTPSVADFLTAKETVDQDLEMFRQSVPTTPRSRRPLSMPTSSSLRISHPATPRRERDYEAETPSRSRGVVRSLENMVLEGKPTARVLSYETSRTSEAGQAMDRSLPLRQQKTVSVPSSPTMQAWPSIFQQAGRASMPAVSPTVEAPMLAPAPLQSLKRLSPVPEGVKTPVTVIAASPHTHNPTCPPVQPMTLPLRPAPQPQTQTQTQTQTVNSLYPPMEPTPYKPYAVCLPSDLIAWLADFEPRSGRTEEVDEGVLVVWRDELVKAVGRVEEVLRERNKRGKRVESEDLLI